MAALALSFIFFAFVAVVGRATLALFRWRGGVLRAWLLAPATGLSVVVLAVMALNQFGAEWGAMGLPIRAFAWPLTLALLAGAIVILLWRRPAFPVRALLPFIGIVLFSLCWTGWPMLRFGFNWLSYVNDDYVNYCLAAERFKDFGFWRVPTMDELAGRDIAQYYWFMHVPGLMRFGSEITLSWVSALTGVKSLGIFMPVIVGLGLIQISSAAALVLHRGRWRRRAAIAAALLAASPLFMLGTLYQLIAQVGGVALFLAAGAFLTTRLPPATPRRMVPYVLGLSVVGSALAVFYPEVSSFPVLAMVGTTLVSWAYDVSRARRESRGGGASLLREIFATFPVQRTRLVIYGCVGAIVLLRFNVLAYVFTIMLQMGQGFRSVDLSLSLFPYFLIPTGLANLFGLMPLSINFAEPFTSLTIVGGLLALLTALGFALRESFRPNPVGVLLVLQVALALFLLKNGNDFGLYKAAMFMQPALAAALACALLKLPWSRITAPLGVLVAAALCAPTALYYTRVSQGEKAGGITEVKFASALGTKPPAFAPNTRLLTDINNLVAAKIAAFELRGTDVRFLSRDYYQQIAPIEYEKLGDTLVGLHPRFKDLMRTRDMLQERDDLTVRTHSLFNTTFRAPALGFGKNGTTDSYLLLDESLGLFNKLHVTPEAFAPETPIPLPPPRQFFKALSGPVARNHLVFMHSGAGNHYYLGDRERIALYQQEADPQTKKQDFTGLGRFMLLRVEQPDEEFYVRILATKRDMGAGHTAWAADAKILGATTVPLGLAGNGAVNRIIGPIRPVFRDGAAYIAIDFSEKAVQFPYKRTGLQSLYNTKVPLDARKLVAYGRDISALSATEVATLPRPSRLARFPEDLIFARGLEYSGIFEEGWLSPKSEFVLHGSTTGGCVRVRGFVPELPGTAVGTGMLKAKVGDYEFNLPAATGTFDWLLPVCANMDTTRLSLHFTVSAPLPHGDDRPVGGKLELIEVYAAWPTNTFDFGTPGRPRLAGNGIDQDGWIARNATIELPPGGKRLLMLKVEFPDWGGKASNTLTATLPTGASTEKTITPGSYSTILLPVPPSAKPQTLSITLPHDFQLHAPDTRRRAARLVQAELQPTTE